MKLILFGSGEFGLPTFQFLHERHEVALVISQPDRPAGRKRVLRPTPVSMWAAVAGLELLKCADVNEEPVVGRIAAAGVDAGVVIAFGQKLGPQLVGSCGRIAVNLHGSLLPKFRGAAPINHAILTGESRTGVSVIALAQRMDAGLIYKTASTPISPLETAGELHDQLATMGPSAVQEVLKAFEAGTIQGVAQDETKASRAPKLAKADGWVDFDADPETVRRRVHGLTPWPGVRVEWHSARSGNQAQLFLRRMGQVSSEPCVSKPGTILDAAAVAVRDGTVRLLEVQLAGGNAMSFDDFVRGHAMEPGDVLVGGRHDGT